MQKEVKFLIHSYYDNNGATWHTVWEIEFSPFVVPFVMKHRLTKISTLKSVAKDSLGSRLSRK